MSVTPETAGAPTATEAADPREPVARLFRDLRTGEQGLSATEASRRLAIEGPNELPSHARTPWWRELVTQLVQPLALLLWLAAALAQVSGSGQLAVAVVAVIALNAGFAFWQESQAERAVGALRRYLPDQVRVVRDGHRAQVAARTLVRGDVILLEEGDRVPADARLVSGALEVDTSALTGESVSVTRDAGAVDDAARVLDSPVLVFSGSTCTAGEATALVHATGAHTELGRIAAMTRRVRDEESPLEHQVRRVAWLIAAVAVGAGAAFLPIGLLAGLSLSAAAVFAIGLLVANVPEGLLPTITLALAAGVREMARKGAVVKRLSAVETLGAVNTICTDKTGTLTANRMTLVALAQDHELPLRSPLAAATAAVLVRCTTADPAGATGDQTELALLGWARTIGVELDADRRDADRLALHRFEARYQRMTTVDRVGGRLVADVKGSPEQVLPRCTTIWAGDDTPPAALDDASRADLERTVATLTHRGLRVLAVARRDLGAAGGDVPDRTRTERELTLLALVGLQDPPREGVAEAVASCHAAGIRIHVVSGDHGATAAQIARQVGIEADQVVEGMTVDAMSESELTGLLGGGGELVVARALPETKLRIADALHRSGDVVAMTGDGVNDAPALRRADIGVAMGASGTDVAREAATVILTDDHFATLAAGISEGRRVFDNVRKFVLYIFAHAVPEVIPFLVFALAGGKVPLPLTVMQILAIDLGTETLPALALGREPAEPGLMNRPPRPRSEGVINRRLLGRAWGLMGLVAAVLVLGAFFAVLLHAGWRPGDATGPGTALHHSYLQATTATFAGIVACQVGTAFAARTEWASLRAIGLTTNRLLLGGVLFEIAFTAAVIYLPPAQTVFATAALPGWVLAMLVPFPLVVWGADELARARRRRHRAPTLRS